MWTFLERHGMDDAHYLRPICQELVERARDCSQHTVPARIPAAPTPQIALPTIKVTEFGAAPQMAEATSNTIILARKTILTENSLYNLPNKSWNAQHVNR